MYTPSHFEQPDKAAIHDAIEAYSFATLVTQTRTGQLTASHVPLLLDRDGGDHGTLHGHVARANPQWQDIAGDALAIFHGPHAFVSAAWYATARTVPTWNYVAVHATGPMELIHDKDKLAALVARLSKQFSGSEWKFDRAEVGHMLEAIVGFRIPIRTLQGKWKLNQNHPPERRQKVIAALEALGGEDNLAIAALMRDNERESK
jgi:transcriptional regulator